MISAYTVNSKEAVNGDTDKEKRSESLSAFHKTSDYSILFLARSLSFSLSPPPSLSPPLFLSQSKSLLKY